MLLRKPYMGKFYISECQNNTYGAGCLKKCGQCLGGEKCNYVNGICINGCEAGYYNFSCKAGIIALTITIMINGEKLIISVKLNYLSIEKSIKTSTLSC